MTNDDYLSRLLIVLGVFLSAEDVLCSGAISALARRWQCPAICWDCRESLRIGAPVGQPKDM